MRATDIAVNYDSMNTCHHGCERWTLSRKKSKNVFFWISKLFPSKQNLLHVLALRSQVGRIVTLNMACNDLPGESGRCDARAAEGHLPQARVNSVAQLGQLLHAAFL